MIQITILRSLITCGLLTAFTGAEAAESSGPGASPAQDAAAAQARLKVASGLKLELWAAEPLVRNITSLSFDQYGRAYVVETGRRRTSVFDIRNLQPWLDKDFSLRSVADRAAFFRHALDPADPGYAAFSAAVNKKGGLEDFNHDGVLDWHDLEVESERIRLVTDTDGDGRADDAITFADDFKTTVSGVAAGVLAHGSNVWFTCIPDLWRMPAAASPGTKSEPATTREKLHSGFGVHVAFGGHDMHGLIMGPDGRLYFSIADRGASLTNREGVVISRPDSGSVFRCEPDGANLELYAGGLRNPQELAFDSHGNLWTGDNNGDGGDKARWTYLVEGAEYGWTMGWQWLPKMGAWNSERLWGLTASNTSAFIVPPVAHVGHGPAGIAYYPGTGLPEKYNDHFFFSDFPGGIRSFKTLPDGDTFKLEAEPASLENNSAASMDGKVLWDLSPVDVAFAPGGGLYVADWVQGWDKTGKGRIWRLFDPSPATDGPARETRRLLSEGFAHRADAELAGLLANMDMRVRLEAQWALAAKGSPSVTVFADAAKPGRPLLARLHAIWGLGQLARRADGAGAQGALIPLLHDDEPEVRGNAARMLGEAGARGLAPKLSELFADESTRTRFLAVWAYASLLLHDNSIPPPAGLAKQMSDDGMEDPLLRHAAALALSRLSPAAGKSLDAWRSNALRAGLRLTALLADRRNHSSAAATALEDAHPVIVLEAARAIYDLPIPEALPQLAAALQEQAESGASQRLSLKRLVGTPPSNWPGDLPFTWDEWRSYILRRAVQAAVRVGGVGQAKALLDAALRTELPSHVRGEAAAALGEWAAPVSRDRIVGLWRPIPPQNQSEAAAALRANLPSLTKALGMPADPAAPSLLEMAANLGISEILPQAREIALRQPVAVWSPQAGPGALEPGLQAAARLAAWRALITLKDPELRQVAGKLAFDGDPALRSEAKLWLANADAPTKWIDMAKALATGGIPERQLAWLQTSRFSNPEADSFVAASVDGVVAGTAAPELALDILTAARLRAKAGAPSVQAALSRWTNSLPKTDPTAPWRPALKGGNPANGRRIYMERQDLACLRCHKWRGNAEGGIVGPDLGTTAATRGVDYVLESILKPSAQIAAGFENVAVTMKNGTVSAGVVKSETAAELVLDSPEDGRLVLKKSEITRRDRAQSAMPEGLADLMSPQELRDLIAFLASP